MSIKTDFIEVTRFGSFTKDYVRGETAYKLTIESYLEQDMPGGKTKQPEATKLRRDLQF